MATPGAGPVLATPAAFRERVDRFDQGPADQPPGRAVCATWCTSGIKVLDQPRMRRSLVTGPRIRAAPRSGRLRFRYSFRSPPSWPLK